MFNFAVTEKVFESKTQFKKAIQAVKNKVLNTEDVILLINANIYNLYNSLVSHFFGGGPVNQENIYKQNLVIEYIEEYEPRNKHLFYILIENGLIGVCGRGFTFESDRINQPQSEYERMIEIIFNKGFVF
ncbi:hypothetical protein PC41400_14580 [Paenibacillus chitinolyticus]|uniref:Uncharacterized protein n=1 Tax=Paenibacillus chitinolyticus TaxID=79263 RepID=A0A410WWQ2_9BACL|nr:hypothetical protein [Paenibacillus chitinolyticus]MCY9594124.1 hypothetical protein [Paenibacillus chitinolyticus]MCY9599660.1 hypothetical protein [Paenibacillus chitinolyticus]QAV18838.1 hypothetical protein PC41400_14580 [Paenibacillus chitinolyticus]